MSHQKAKRRSAETDIGRSVRLEQDAASKANNRVCESHEQTEVRRNRAIARHNRKRRRDSTAAVHRLLMISPVSVQKQTLLGVVGTRTPSSRRYKQIWFAFIAKFRRCISRNVPSVVRRGLR